MAAIDLRQFQGGTDEQIRTGDPLPVLSKVELALRNYFRLRGRASRSECWWFALASTLVSMLVGGAGETVDADGLAGLVALLIWIPSFTVGVRRLHDVNRSGWWMLAAMTGIGWLLLLFWWVQPGDAGPNRFNLTAS